MSPRQRSCETEPDLIARTSSLIRARSALYSCLDASWSPSHLAVCLSSFDRQNSARRLSKIVSNALSLAEVQDLCVLALQHGLLNTLTALLDRLPPLSRADVQRMRLTDPQLFSAAVRAAVHEPALVHRLLAPVTRARPGLVSWMEDGVTPLMRAALELGEAGEGGAGARGAEAVVGYLLELGADANAISRPFGAALRNSAARHATKFEPSSTVTPEPTTPGRSTPAHSSSSPPSCHTNPAFVPGGASKEQFSCVRCCSTALHEAASHGSVAVVLRLLQGGADGGVRDDNGRTARDVAGALEHRAVLMAMDAHAAGEAVPLSSPALQAPRIAPLHQNPCYNDDDAAADANAAAVAPAAAAPPQGQDAPQAMDPAQPQSPVTTPSVPVATATNSRARETPPQLGSHSPSSPEALGDAKHRGGRLQRRYLSLRRTGSGSGPGGPPGGSGSGSLSVGAAEWDSMAAAVTRVAMRQVLDGVGDVDALLERRSSGRKLEKSRHEEVAAEDATLALMASRSED